MCAYRERLREDLGRIYQMDLLIWATMNVFASERSPAPEKPILLTR